MSKIYKYSVPVVVVADSTEEAGEMLTQAITAVCDDIGDYYVINQKGVDKKTIQSALASTQPPVEVKEEYNSNQIDPKMLN